jgi:ATP-dependent RNA helicase DDX10/DBP4
VLADHYAKLIEEDGSGQGVAPDEDMQEDSEDGFMSVKRRFEAGDDALDYASESDAGSSSSEDDKENDPSPHQSKDTKKSKTVQLGPKAEDKLIIDSKRREKLLKSKKKLLKFKGHGDHLHFDSDSDTPHQKHYYEDEVEFTKEGAAEEQRRKFVGEERAKAKERDLLDKEVARQKKREKKERRKGRERAEVEDGDEEVRVELAPFEEEDRGMVDGPEQKRQKKWFEDPSGDEDNNSRHKGKKGKRVNVEEAEEPQTLEDLEAMASGLLRT